jgi:hypothetical protein
MPITLYSSTSQHEREAQRHRPLRRAKIIAHPMGSRQDVWPEAFNGAGGAQKGPLLEQLSTLPTLYL